MATKLEKIEAVLSVFLLPVFVFCSVCHPVDRSTDDNILLSLINGAMHLDRLIATVIYAIIYIKTHRTFCFQSVG